MQKLTYNDVHKKSLGLNASFQYCVFDTDETTVLFNLEKPTQTNAVVALSDAAATLTGAQLADSRIFTITPSEARILTTDTAANIIAAIPGYRVGLCFNFTIVCLAAFDVTLAAGANITLVGKAIVNNVSGTWRARIDSATAITIYRT